MKRFISVITCTLCVLMLSAQNFKVIKVGGKVPLYAKTGKAIRQGERIDNIKSIKWPSQDSWVKVYNMQKRRITYFGPRGESAKGKAFVTGNSDLSCRVSFDDSDSPQEKIYSSFSLSIPNEFRLHNGNITPSYFVLGNDVDLQEGDYICASYYYNGEQFFQKLYPNRDIDGKLKVDLNANTFNVKALYINKWNGYYVSFYLVHKNNYTLLKDRCILWTML